ncbi:MAG: hypothetical protein P4L40_07120 [Terracidiphilus sp.]|nr:hypothetical protein [Terracidiphilus sp.]
MKWMSGVLWTALLSAGCTAAMGQTTIAISGYGAFSGTTNGNGTIQSPSNAAGAMAELRHIRNPLIGYEATYSWNRANQTYNASSYSCPGGVTPCAAPTPAAVSANAHEITADWVVSAHLLNLRPFALGGVGVLLNQPVSGQSSTTSSTKPVFVYGAGVDWGVLPHLGLRFQYRGNLYKAPDVTKLYTSTDKFTQTAEPMIGAYFRF